MEIFKKKNLEEIELEFTEEEKTIKINIKKNYIPEKTPISYERKDIQIPESIGNIHNTEIETEGTIVKAPISGNFYLYPFPGAEPFIQEGQEISKGQVICIIESMKVLNEIESPYNGTVKKILVENSKFVKEGDPLIILI
ncbi:MAG: acetyl-CoA carboxylase biotin carboxyl carrier protein subunit [Candidatus Calescibacterium sp.]|nr:acetyl-CoA carboxylase, biotin carboxyl carrier protein [Candidatus Calescibacterium sp.]MDW8132951.1 acetyl-CoA carboxylase biotin carboxyl carrier protein subunit [Candidatus Calescibacterium sp.]